MKTKLFAMFTVFMFAAVAHAHWEHLGGNRYSDGVWEYEATFNRWSCKWEYRKIQPIAPNASDNSFDSKALGFIERLSTQRRNESILNKFSSLLGDTGLTQQTSYKSYGRTTTTSYPAFFGGGQSAIGQVQAVPYRRLNPEPLIQDLMRLQERSDATRPQVMAELKSAVSEYTDAAKIESAMNAYAVGAQAVAAATLSNRTQVVETTTEPQQNFAYHTQRQPQDQETSIMLALADNVVSNNCASCHGPIKRAGGHDFTSEDVTQLWPKMRNRIHSPRGTPHHMPPNGQLSQTQMDLLDMKYGIPAQEETIPQVQPYSDQPPAPPAELVPPQPQPNQQGKSRPLVDAFKQLVQGVMANGGQR